jgi:hypothetical protein
VSIGHHLVPLVPLLLLLSDTDQSRLRDGRATVAALVVRVGPFSVTRLVMKRPSGRNKQIKINIKGPVTVIHVLCNTKIIFFILKTKMSTELIVS